MATQQEIRDHLEEYGYFAPVRLMTAEEASGIRYKVEAFERAHPDRIGLIDMKANLLFPWIDSVTRNVAMLDALEAILGPNVLCRNCCFRNKAPDGRTYVSWHQDTPYIKVEPLMITTWLAVTPATTENGCLRIIPGSHKWPKLPHAEKMDPNSMLTRGHYIDAEFDRSGAIDVELEAGEALIIHYNIAHSSAPNHSADRRMGMLIDCVSTHAVKLGNRERAMLVRGVDDTGNWDLESPPRTSLGGDELAAHRMAVKLVAETFYAGSERVPEALSGKARNPI
jgi:non-heme Fe2+,alpha-ketoglutarate-dependent halogenase